MHYAIGDIQGDLTSLKRLLIHIDFNPSQDNLFFLGDIVNRGKESLATLIFIKKLVEAGAAKMVLGNHDYYLLVCGYTDKKPSNKDTLAEILNSDNCAELLNFLRQQPLLIKHQNYLLSHAGIPPQWDTETAIIQANSVSMAMQQDLSDLPDYLLKTYENVAEFSAELNPIKQQNYTINALMRMRFCTAQGKLEFQHKNNQTKAPAGFKAWFEHPRKTQENLIFGHWSSLKPLDKQHSTIHALDTGCIWGQKLSAMCLETKEIFSVNCA